MVYSARHSDYQQFARLLGAVRAWRAAPCQRALGGAPATSEFRTVNTEEHVQQAEPGRRRGAISKLADWAANNVAAALTILGVLAYAALRLAFEAFYAHFKVSPEDVGYDYATLLTTTLPGLSPFVLLTFVAVGAMAYMARRREDEGYRLSARLAVAYAVILPLYGIVGIIITLTLSGVRFGEAIDHGKPLDRVHFLGLPVFPWTVQPVTVTPVTRDAQATLTDLRTGCLMYLGQSGSSYVLYDPRAHASLKVPVAAVSVRIGTFPRGQDCPHKLSGSE